MFTSSKFTILCKQTNKQQQHDVDYCIVSIYTEYLEIKSRELPNWKWISKFCNLDGSDYKFIFQSPMLDDKVMAEKFETPIVPLQLSTTAILYITAHGEYHINH